MLIGVNMYLSYCIDVLLSGKYEIEISTLPKYTHIYIYIYIYRLY